MDHSARTFAVGPVHPLRDLGQERVDDPRSTCRQLGGPSCLAFTYRRTVFWSTPAMPTVEWAHTDDVTAYREVDASAVRGPADATAGATSLVAGLARRRHICIAPMG